MPNWTYNSVEITGSVQDVQEFLDTVKATDSEGNNYFDFTQVNPIPSELQDVHTGAITIDEVRVDAWYEDDDDTRRPLLDMTKDELTEKYGTYQPIDWQYNNWGTKWGDCETKLIDDVINKDGRDYTLPLTLHGVNHLDYLMILQLSLILKLKTHGT